MGARSKDGTLKFILGKFAQSRPVSAPIGLRRDGLNTDQERNP